MPHRAWLVRSTAVVVLAALAVAHAPAAHAAWPHSPTINLPVCTATGDQLTPVSVSDGAGGMIIVWSDQRGGGGINADIYAQHVLASGSVDPAWPANGRVLCAAI